MEESYGKGRESTVKERRVVGRRYTNVRLIYVLFLIKSRLSDLALNVYANLQK